MRIVCDGRSRKSTLVWRWQEARDDRRQVTVTSDYLINELINEDLLSNVVSVPAILIGPTVFRGPRNLSRAEDFGFLPRNSSFSAEFDVFYSITCLFTENYLKVALLQVCL